MYIAKPCYPIFMGKLKELGWPALVILCITFLSVPLNFGQDDDYRQTVITDPSISRRCNALMKQRNQKIDHKQKIRSLLERNRRLIKITPPERQSLLKKLRKNFKSLSYELRHTLNQIQNKEESIIRKGCPGIVL